MAQAPHQVGDGGVQLRPALREHLEGDERHTHAPEEARHRGDRQQERGQRDPQRPARRLRPGRDRLRRAPVDRQLEARGPLRVELEELPERTLGGRVARVQQQELPVVLDRAKLELLVVGLLGEPVAEGAREREVEGRIHRRDARRALELLPHVGLAAAHALDERPVARLGLAQQLTRLAPLGRLGLDRAPVRVGVRLSFDVPSRARPRPALRRLGRLRGARGVPVASARGEERAQDHPCSRRLHRWDRPAVVRSLGGSRVPTAAIGGPHD